MSREPSPSELDDVVDFWFDNPQGTTFYVETSLYEFLRIFNPAQIKGAMYLATSKRRGAYFRYLCGILHAWRSGLHTDGEIEVVEMNAWADRHPAPKVLSSGTAPAALQGLLEANRQLERQIASLQEQEVRKARLAGLLARHGCHLRKQKAHGPTLVITHPYRAGTRKIEAPASDADLYRDDPAEYMAHYYGVTREQYLEWHASHYEVRCSGHTDAGSACRSMVKGSYGETPASWVASNGTLYCHHHDPNGRSQRRKAEAAEQAALARGTLGEGGVGVVARFLGVTRYRVRQIQKDAAHNFPQPYALSDGYDYWSLDGVSRWEEGLNVETRRRLMLPAQPATPR